MKPSLVANAGSMTWQNASFRPRGSAKGHGKGHRALIQNGLRQNRSESFGPMPTAARLFVGFNIGHEPVWKLEDVIRMVLAFRKEQDAPPDSTFIAQKGIYTHQDGSGIVEEDGAQIIVLNTYTDDEAFKNQMLALAEHLALEMNQESVIVDLQEAGVSKDVLSVTPY
jgi:hypothetical protein